MCILRLGFGLLLLILETSWNAILTLLCLGAGANLEVCHTGTDRFESRDAQPSPICSQMTSLLK